MEELIEQAMARHRGANRDAVENFCFSAPDDKMANAINLKADARSYRWNGDTVNAIQMVLRGTNKL